MDILIQILQSVVPFLLVLSVLVYVHEMGHYVVARMNGVRVEVFSIGFGPELFGWTNKNKTRWKVSLIPLGGYVKIANEEDIFSDEGREKLEKKMPSDSLLAKSVGQRIAVSVAGPGANYIFSILLLAVLYTTVGQRVMEPGSVIGRVMPAGAAEKAGLESGDSILEVDGQAVKSVEILQNIIHQNAHKTINFVVKRQDLEKTIPVTIDGDDQGRGRIGVELRPVMTIAHHGFFKSLLNAAIDAYDISVKTLLSLGEMLTGKRSADGLSGPIGIASIVGDVAQKGFIEILFLAAFLSINLGLINLFPIPVLDGGHILLYIMEGIRGRPVPERIQNVAFNIGFGLMAALFIFTFWNDLMRLHVVHKILSLFNLTY